MYNIVLIIIISHHARYVRDRTQPLKRQETRSQASCIEHWV